MLINIKEKIRALKNDSEEYNRAIDNVLSLFIDIHKTCKIVHKKSGLLFNGYDENYLAASKGKNTLSKTNFKRFSCYNKNDEDILKQAFDGHTTVKDGRTYLWNVVVYEGSEINKILSQFYNNKQYLPLDDFYVERL